MDKTDTLEAVEADRETVERAFQERIAAIEARMAHEAVVASLRAERANMKQRGNTRREKEVAAELKRHGE